jgi:hypothetical protein
MERERDAKAYRGIRHFLAKNGAKFAWHMGTVAVTAAILYVLHILGLLH